MKVGQKNETQVLDHDRRKFLVGAGLVVAATQLGALSLLGCKNPEASASTQMPAAPVPTTPTQTPATPVSAPSTPSTASVPWKYVKLDSVAAAERGYAAYYQGGCMFGAFEGIIGELREKAGPPFDAFPAAMMKYGKAGINGWGTICGALNGASAMIYMVTEPKTGDGLIDELFAWYSAEAMPNYRPKSPKFDIKTSASQSPLCHISVTNWCETSGFKALSPERAERCGWLTASVVKHTTELLNNLNDGKAAVMPALSTEVSGCLACHGKGGIKENVHASKAASCAICHEPHPIK